MVRGAHCQATHAQVAVSTGAERRLNRRVLNPCSTSLMKRDRRYSELPQSGTTWLVETSVEHVDPIDPVDPVDRAAVVAPLRYPEWLLEREASPGVRKMVGKIDALIRHWKKALESSADTELPVPAATATCLSPRILRASFGRSRWRWVSFVEMSLGLLHIHLGLIVLWEPEAVSQDGPAGKRRDGARV